MGAWACALKVERGPRAFGVVPPRHAETGSRTSKDVCCSRPLGLFHVHHSQGAARQGILANALWPELAPRGSVRNIPQSVGENASQRALTTFYPVFRPSTSGAWPPGGTTQWQPS